MNKKTNVLGIVSGLMLVLAVGFTSCTKEGAAGPKGDTGATGAQGNPGAQGPQGTSGTSANVYYSAWTNVTFKPDSMWNTSRNKYDTIGYKASIAAPKLVDSILQKGEIKVYATVPDLVHTTNGTAVTVPLPFFDYNYMLIGQGVSITPGFKLNQISLYADFNATTWTNPVVFQYRYILIPGLTTGRVQGVNWDNYEEVKKYLGLKD